MTSNKINGSYVAKGSTPQATVGDADIWERLPRPLSGINVLAASAVLSAVATAIGLGFLNWLPQQSVPLLYVLCVVLAAIGLGVWTGLATAVLSFLTYNFFFIPPIYTFTIADPKELFALMVFFSVAVVTGSLAGRMRGAADAARQRAANLLSLNQFAGQLSGASSIGSILDAVASQAAATVRGSAVVMLKCSGELELRASVPPNVVLQPDEWQAAQRTLRSGETTFAAAPEWPGARYEFRPLTTAGEVIGAIGLAPSNGQRVVASDDDAALQTILRHATIAIERTQLEAEGTAAREEVERERTRSSLLSSLSHDLRTPLASILGSVTSLRELGTNLPAETRADLLQAIEEETGRLSRFVANLLDMTRLDTDALDLKTDWVDVGDAAQIAVTRARRLFPGFKFTYSGSPHALIVRGDATLLEHVVFNLLDNAIKYSTPELSIEVDLRTGPEGVTLTVTDQGRGIPNHALASVFAKFYRIRDGHPAVPGTGLGLTICKRIVEAMAGTIHAESPASDDRGTRIVVRLPVSDQDVLEEFVEEGSPQL